MIGENLQGDSSSSSSPLPSSNNHNDDPQQEERMNIPLHSKQHDSTTNNNNDDNDNLEEEEEEETTTNLMTPLIINTSSNDNNNIMNEIRSRKRNSDDDNNNKDNDIDELTPNCTNSSNNNNNPYFSSSVSSSSTSQNHQETIKQCCIQTNEIRKNLLRNTKSCRNILTKLLFWSSLLLTIIGVAWWSKELAHHGTDVHLIAWFSAGAFVILGFPISIYGILMHLMHYYQPNVQCYVVRILWMVPIYSIESWLCLRFHEFAIYIETLRDCYESYVLYSFLHFLIEVLGGEESLIMMLKDKSPTRGVHYAPLNWFMKPWVMGQPASRVDIETGERSVKWTSPFFKHCKLGCLQYVLLKLVCTVATLILEHFDLYKEGDFTPKGGYLYICILTNTSQCWALYCLIFFYYATKNELGPIRPVGKFLAVKSLVFFTWWQALGISMLHEMKLIPSYEAGGWTTEEVARGLQAYLICIEMFIAAVLHIFIFPHTDYLKPMSVSRPSSEGFFKKGRRVGRRFNNHKMRTYGGFFKDDSSKTSDVSSKYDFDYSLNHNNNIGARPPPMKAFQQPSIPNTNNDIADIDSLASPGTQQQRKGFVHALIDSTIPIDVMDNTVGIARGDFTVEKRTLLYHAAASDQYSLFAKRRKELSKVAKRDDEKSSDGGSIELK